MLLGGALPSQSQTTAPPASKTRAHVQTLASEKLEGRQAGSPGEKLAADYIVRELTRIGAKPLPGQSSFFNAFEFTAGTKDAGSTLTVTRAGGVPEVFVSTTHVQAMSFSDSAEVSGPVVFAGYGLVVPESQNFGYDSFVGLDVKDKIVDRSPLLPRGCGSEDAADSRALLRPALQGTRGAAARRQRHARRDRPGLAERRRRRFR